MFCSIVDYIRKKGKKAGRISKEGRKDVVWGCSIWREGNKAPGHLADGHFPKNKYREIYWSMTRISAELRTTTSKLHVRDQG